MWTEVIPGVVIALLLLVGPGLVVLLCTRVSVPTALVASPPVSLAVIAVSTLIAGIPGARWGPLWVLGTALAIAAACALWSWATPWGRRTPRWSLLTGPAAVQYLIGQVIALIFMVPLFLKAFVEPTTIAQRYDNAFHLNAIESIRRTGEATPFDSGEMLRGSIYPNGWHTAGALVQELSGLALPQSVHALALVVVLGIWPMGMWLLIEVLVKPSAAVRLISGPLMFAFPGFPLVLLDWGLVYPTILGLAVAPVLAAVLLHTILQRTLLVAPVQVCTVIALAGIGVGIAHPGSALAGLIIAFPIAIAALIRHLDRAVLRPSRSGPDSDAHSVEPADESRRISRGDLVWAGLLAALCVMIGAVWLVMTPGTDTAPWSTFESTPQALGEVAFGGAMGRPTLMIVTVLCGLGLLSAFLGRGRDRLVLLALAGPGLVYWASAAAPVEAWRDILSGFFYRDNFRTAAALTLVAVPVAVKGVETLARGVTMLLALAARRRGRNGSPRSLTSTIAALIVGVLAATGLASHVSADPEMQAQYVQVSEAYRTWEFADIVSGDEFRMFEELPDFVPEDAYVIADPWEGGGLAYAFSDREVGRIYMTVRRTPDERYVDSHLKDIGTDPRVCDALPDDQPLYYLDLEEHRLGADEPDISGYLGYQGITEDTRGFDLVHEVGEVRLYEVDAC